MKIIILTSTATRHKYIANFLAKQVESLSDILVFSEEKSKSSSQTQVTQPITEHFRLRDKVELDFFGKDSRFIAPAIFLDSGQINLVAAYDIIKAFQPSLIFVFGTSIIREPLLSLIPKNRFINLHLGLSPYYRGSGTNFWPFVNNELECIGTTFLHIDAGIDTGDIIAHTRPLIKKGDTVHTLGCKAILASADTMLDIINLTRAGVELPRVSQWSAKPGRYYKKSDFDPAALSQYLSQLDSGQIERYLSHPKEPENLISLPN